ncbi:hypothetical protein TRFO_09470 [Tritrichomonas foetus]|uniref:Uncharacterized protein n=1 Tax=Tritrichomonas foetus TaxID=1144522 RepID=A0A1J4JFL4_9EUKA|nr:hypothetical protein TRFO_09470 [Tritrichomonas foetus]|eukprot:OHS97457.1 hypothetical protein TRFO_09470 [Tritrichomonas foetus]
MSSTISRSDAQALLAQIIAGLRAKKREISDQYLLASRKLMRSFDLSPKDEIIKNAHDEHRLAQLKSIVEQSTRTATSLNMNFNDFYRNYENNQSYFTLCSHSKILEVEQIDSLAQALPPKKQVKQVEIQPLGDKEVGAYVRKFAENKGSSQGADERLLDLFRPPKAQQVRPSPKREND